MKDNLKQQIQESIKTAMRTQDKVRLGTLRLISAAIKQKEVDERIVLSDDQILSILDKMIKQRRESVLQFEKGNRPELVAAEQAEIVLIQSFLPAPLTETEIMVLIERAISETNATSLQEMGKVMNFLKPAVQGRADMSVISALIKAALSR